MYIWEENVIELSNISLCVSATFRLPTSDGSASKGKQQTSEPVHILKRSFARTVSVVSHLKKIPAFLSSVQFHLDG